MEKHGILWQWDFNTKNYFIERNGITDNKQRKISQGAFKDYSLSDMEETIILFK